MIHMDIEMRIGHLNILCIKYVFNLLVYAEQGIPVVFTLAPDLQSVLDGTVSVAGNAHKGGRVLQNSGEICGFSESIQLYKWEYGAEDFTHIPDGSQLFCDRLHKFFADP